MIPASHPRRRDWSQMFALGLLLAACVVLFTQQRRLDDERAARQAREQACRDCTSPLPE